VKWLDGLGFLKPSPTAIAAEADAGRKRAAGAKLRQGRLLIRGRRGDEAADRDYSGRVPR
jgi:hypothetical protein